MTDAELVAHYVATVAASADLYPGAIILHNLGLERGEYMSDGGLRGLDTSIAELHALGNGYHERFFNPDDAADYVPRILSLLEHNDPQYFVTFFQQVRTGPSRAYRWYFTTARVLGHSTAGRPLLILNHSCPVDPKSHQTAKVQRLLDENTFLRQHTGTFARLTPRERAVLRGLALGQSAPESAAALHITTQTVETHRRNLRQKLGTTSPFELGQYARAFDLI